MTSSWYHPESLIHTQRTNQTQTLFEFILNIFYYSQLSDGQPSFKNPMKSKSKHFENNKGELNGHGTLIYSLKKRDLQVSAFLAAVYWSLAASKLMLTACSWKKRRNIDSAIVSESKQWSSCVPLWWRCYVILFCGLKCYVNFVWLDLKNWFSELYPWNIEISSLFFCFNAAEIN